MMIFFRILLFLLYSFVIFLVITIVFSSFESSQDGFDKIGFPLVFYQHLGGKSDNPDRYNWFNAWYLGMDIAFSFITAVLGKSILKVLKVNT